jgi:hypothetical protein
MVKLRNEYLEQTGRTQRVKYLRNLIHGQVSVYHIEFRYAAARKSARINYLVSYTLI